MSKVMGGSDWFISLVIERDKLKVEVEACNERIRLQASRHVHEIERERAANAKLKAELTEAQGYIEGQDKEIIRLQTELRLFRKDRDQTREISQRRGLELASQRAANAKLREALVEIKDLSIHDSVIDAYDIAKKALLAGEGKVK